MSFSNILEVVLGLSLAYYILGLIVSSVSNLILNFWGKRGDILRKYLVSIVIDPKNPAAALLENPYLATEWLNNPDPAHVEAWLKDPKMVQRSASSEVNGKARGWLRGWLPVAGPNELKQHFSANTLAAAGHKEAVDALLNNRTHFDDLLRSLNLVNELLETPQIKSLIPIGPKGMWGWFGTYVEKKPIEKIPAANLAEGLLDLLERKPRSEGNSNSEHLAASSEIEKTLASFRQFNFSTDELQNRMEKWADGLIGQIRNEYALHARSWVLLFSLAVTLAFGLDTIEYATDLWNNPERRAIAVAIAEAEVADGEGQGASVGGLDEAEFAELLEEAQRLNMKIGWFALAEHRPDPLEVGFAAMLAFWFWKVIGLLVTTIAVAQGSSFWYDTLKRISPDQGATP